MCVSACSPPTQRATGVASSRIRNIPSIPALLFAGANYHLLLLRVQRIARRPASQESSVLNGAVFQERAERRNGGTTNLGLLLAPPNPLQYQTVLPDAVMMAREKERINAQSRR